MKNILYYILLIVLGAIIGSLLRKPKEQPPKIIIEEKVVRDTVTVYEPKIVTELLQSYDTIYIEVFGNNNEKLSVPLIRQSITYSDDSTYKAVVSGYNPKLDFIETYNTTKYITERVNERPKKWGISALIGTSFVGTEGSLYGAGELSYTENKWTLSGQIGRDFTTKNTFIGFELGLNIVSW